MWTRGRIARVGAAAAAWCLAAPVSGQELAARVAAAGQGWVTFTVPVEDNVLLCGEGLRIEHGNGAGTTRWQRGPHGEEDCVRGPMQVEFRLEDGRVEALTAGRVRAVTGARELGGLDPAEASRFLVSLAYRDADPEAAERGLFLSRLPRGADPSAGILRVARDRDLPESVRRAGIFWTGQMATEIAVAPLVGLARTDGKEGVREAAVFALSQRKGEAALESLMELATEAPHPETRRMALFWLAQRDEPGVVDFLAGIILDRRGG